MRQVLMVHGAGGGGWEWNVWRRVFAARGWRVDAPDLAADTLDAYAAQVDAPRGAVLIGASLGGLLVLMSAARCAPSALVLVNPLPPAPWHGLLPRRDWPDLVPWRRDASLAGTRNALPDADAATSHYAFRRWRDESGAVLRAAFAGVAIERPDAPLLVLAAEHDTDVPPAASAALAGALRASLVACAEASHVGPLLGRDAARCARLALDFVTPFTPSAQC